MSAAVNGRDTGMPTIEHVSAYTASRFVTTKSVSPPLSG